MKAKKAFVNKSIKFDERHHSYLAGHIVYGNERNSILSNCVQVTNNINVLKCSVNVTTPTQCPVKHILILILMAKALCSCCNSFNSLFRNICDLWNTLCSYCSLFYTSLKSFKY